MPGVPRAACMLAIVQRGSACCVSDWEEGERWHWCDHWCAGQLRAYELGEQTCQC